jgi:hypothetical protein
MIGNVGGIGPTMVRPGTGARMRCIRAGLNFRIWRWSAASRQPRHQGRPVPRRFQLLRADIVRQRASRRTPLGARTLVSDGVKSTRGEDKAMAGSGPSSGTNRSGASKGSGFAACAEASSKSRLM